MRAKSLLYFPLQLVSSFLPPSPQPALHVLQRRRPGSPASRSIPSTSHGVVFTRLSEDCVQALDIAQEQAALLNQKEVDDTFMLLGITEMPGKAKSTFDKYGITWSSVRRVLNYLTPEKTEDDDGNGQSKRSAGSAPRLRDFAAKSSSGSLPYSKSLQSTLFEAGEIAQLMGSSSILPEHVFLALLDYKEIEETGEAQAASRDDDCEAMEILWHLDATLEGEDICFDLLTTLMESSPSELGQREEGDGANSNKALDTSSVMAQGTSSERNSTPSLLTDCSVDLTEQAKEGELDVVYGRDGEISTVMRILLRRRKNSPVLIGETGVGKSAIIEGLAQLLVSDKCPALLKGHRIISLEVSSLVAGTQYRGEFEARFRSLMKELTDDPTPTILFLDEMHSLVGAGSTEGGSMDAASLLKPYLARGKLKVMGATTISEYQRCIASDPAFERRLQPVRIDEPSVEQTIGILGALQSGMESHHRVEYSKTAVEAAVNLSDRYIADRFLPDKAIDVLDEAGATATLERKPDEAPPVVTEEVIARVISKLTNVPIGNLEMDEMDRLNALEETLNQHIKGQDRAINAVAKAIRRSRSGIRNPNRPVACMLFCGPTGTGKTALCKALATSYYGSSSDLIRLDMSEFIDQQSVSRLIGPPPGIKGCEDGGQLTNAVRTRPWSIVLLDELEKAHEDILNTLLQVMEDGRLTDGMGRTVSFKHVVLIATSNIGSSTIGRIVDLARTKSEEQNSEQSLFSKLAGAVRKDLEKALRPEFLNRFDDIVIFEPLSNHQLELICLMNVVDVTSRAQVEKNIEAGVSPALLHKMTTAGSRLADRFGARPMRRAVQKYFEDCLSDAIVQGFVGDGDSVSFDLGYSMDGEEAEAVVVARRSSDDEELRITIQESAADIGEISGEANEENAGGDEDDKQINGNMKTHKVVMGNED